MSLHSWSFQDNGAANANGGVYGPFEFDAFGLMFVGATVPGGAGPSLENVQIRVHPGWKPILLTKDASAFPSLGADGIPMTSGQWFKFGSKNTQWYFSIPNQNVGEVITYWFLAIEDQCFDGNGLKLDATDLAAGGGGGTSVAGTATAATQLIAPGTNNLRGWYLSNFDAAPVYLQVFDAPNPAAVALGATVPDLSLGVPAGAAANVLGQARNFIKGIVIAATTTRTGAVAPGVALDFNLFI